MATLAELQTRREALAVNARLNLTRVLHLKLSYLWKESQRARCPNIAATRFRALPEKACPRLSC